MPGGYKGHHGRKRNASTIVDRQREQGWEEPIKRRLRAAPADLTKVAKTQWRRMGHHLQEAGLLTNLDTIALAA